MMDSIFTIAALLSSLHQVIKWRGMRTMQLQCPWARSPDLSGIEGVLAKLGLPLFPYAERCPNTRDPASNSAPCCGKTKMEGGKKVPNMVPYWDPTGSFGDVDPSHPEGHSPNLVRGSEGTQFPPGLTDFSYLSLWVPPLYRHIVLGVNKTLNREVAGTGDADVVVKGIKLKRFTTPEWGVGNSSEYPPNANYYMLGPAGMQNMSVAQQGAPVFISKPHFLDCGPGAVREVTGLSPDRKRHDTFLDVEPSTGITMQEHKRIQINLQIRRVNLTAATAKEDAAWFKGLGARKIYVPMMWLEEQSVISDPQAKEFKQVYTVRLVGAWAAVGGAVLLAATLALAFRVWQGPGGAAEVPAGFFDEPLLGERIIAMAKKQQKRASRKPQEDGSPATQDEEEEETMSQDTDEGDAGGGVANGRAAGGVGVMHLNASDVEEKWDGDDDGAVAGHGFVWA